MALKPHQVGLQIFYDGTDSPVDDEEEVVEENNNNSDSDNDKSAEYTVVPGDTLWGLAEKFLGNGARWTEIAEANREVCVDTAKQFGIDFDDKPWLWAGETLKIPGVTSNVGGEKPAKETKQKTKKESKGTEYIVQTGDTLWGLAERFLGNGARWEEIANANRDTVVSTANDHGIDFDDKPWLWTGEKLYISDGSEEDEEESEETEEEEDTPPVKAEFDNTLGNKMVEQAVAFTYTDPAFGESDSVSISLADLGKEWLDDLMPKKGACLIAKLLLTNWEDEERVDKFKCGKFLIDNVTPSGRPLQMVVDAASSPLDTAFTTLDRDKTWEATTIENIASSIASTANVSLVYDADTVWIEQLEQNNKTDSAFLKGLCDEYGLGMKVYNRKIVIFDIAQYEKKPAVLTLTEDDLLDWSGNMTIDGVYTGVTLEYTDPAEKSKEKLTVSVGDTTTRPYKVSKQADSEADARAKAIAALDLANRKIQTMNITVRGRIDLVSGQCIKIEGLGKLDGKYFIDKMKHSIGSGYKITMDIHLVEFSEKTGEGADAEENTAETTYKIGDKVKLTGVYISSDSNQKLTPLITEGTIEKVLLGTANPYLVYSGSTGIGWVNEGCISK